MKRVCAWCNRDMGEKPDEGGDPRAITHGICEDWLERLFEDRRRKNALPFHILSN